MYEEDTSIASHASLNGYYSSCIFEWHYHSSCNFEWHYHHLAHRTTEEPEGKEMQKMSNEQPLREKCGGGVGAGVTIHA